MSLSDQTWAFSQLEKIKAHVDSGPLGWFNGTVRAPRGTTDQDVIVWLATLRDLVGLSGIDNGPCRHPNIDADGWCPDCDRTNPMKVVVDITSGL